MLETESDGWTVCWGVADTLPADVWLTRGVQPAYATLDDVASSNSRLGQTSGFFDCVVQSPRYTFTLAFGGAAAAAPPVSAAPAAAACTDARLAASRSALRRS